MKINYENSKLGSMCEFEPMKFSDFGYKSVTGTMFLNIQDLRNIFNCGDTKARKIMDQLPWVKFGNSKRVHGDLLAKYLNENRGFDLEWD